MQRPRLALAVLAVLLAAPATSAAQAPMSGARAKATVAQIAALGPRPAGSVNERRTARIVGNRFRRLGLPLRIQRFRLPNGQTSRNVVAQTPGRLRAVIVAHMDGVRAGPAANDNGSGVATMLEVASALKETEGVIFAALGAEEREMTGSHLHLGSARLVQSLPRVVRPRIRLAVSLDMVGVGSTLNVRGLEARPNRSSQVLLARGRAVGYRVTYLRDSGVSDHAELTRAGIPASLVTWRWDTCWHRSCDRVRRISARKMMATARMTVASVRAVLRRR